MKWRFFFPIILCSAALLAYGNSFRGVFLFDDIARIVEEKHIRQLWPIWPLLSGERPLVDLSLAANYAISRLNPWSYHALNLLIHVLAGLTLSGVVRRSCMIWSNSAATGSVEKGSVRVNEISAALLAFAVALIFLVHPLQTQSVAYVIQRGESMMGLFYLLTLYCAIRAAESPGGRRWQAASIVACAAGMATKAVMITAPVIVLLYDWVFFPQKKIKGRIWLYLGLCSTWVILLLTGIAQEVMGQAGGVSHVGFASEAVSPLQYASAQPGVIIKYLQLALWPASLCLDYAWSVPQSWGLIIVPLLLVLFLLGLAVWSALRRHWLGFAGLSFFLILSPTSTFVPVKDLLFEHRMYLPLACVIVAIVVPLYLVLRWAFPAYAPGVFFGVVLLAATPLAYATHERNKVYHSELAMWQDVVSKRPGNARAHVAVGTALAAQGKLDEALRKAQEAIAIDPQFADAHFAAGSFLARMKKPEEAIESFQAAIRLIPHHSRAWYNLGNVYRALGRLDEATKAYEKSTSFNPTFADAFCNWGNVLLDQGRAADGVEKLRTALALDAQHAIAHNNLGDALVMMGQYDEARAHFEKALEWRPDYHRARFNLAVLYKRLGRLPEAIRECRTILSADPGNKAAEELLYLTMTEMNQ